eukprot:Clim_evm69s147 gene=Clim_evmTU69s147
MSNRLNFAKLAASWVADCSFVPILDISGTQIRALKEPQEFYQHLLHLTNNSRRRINITSLYLGTGKSEEYLASSLYSAAKSGAQVRVVLDACRGTRVENGRTSADMLHDLSTDFPDQTDIRLWRNPLSKGWLGRLLPQKFNEILGIQHSKIYIGDDNVIISGANLSRSYFEDRTDRYIYLENCKPLADYLSDVVNLLADISVPLPPKGTKGVPECTLEASKMYSILSESLHKLKSEHHMPHTTDAAKLTAKEDALTLVAPAFHFGPSLLKSEVNMFAHFLANMDDTDLAHISTGYFNPTFEHIDMWMTSAENHQVDLLCAAPEANGFFGDKSIAGRIPQYYSYLERGMFDAIQANPHSAANMQMYEWLKPAWTFHAKGLWLSSSRGEKLPYGVSFGSSNFGWRSVQRDLEVQMWMLTDDPTLQKELAEERDRIFADSVPLTKNSWKRQARYWSFLTELTSSYIRGVL